MPQRVSGINDQAITQWEEQIAYSRTGAVTVTRTEAVPVAMILESLKPPGTQHPRFPALLLDKCDAVKIKAGAFYNVTSIYAGLLGGDSTTDGATAPVYELRGTANDEPIETHPDFATIAGTPSAPLNGAIFVDPETDKVTTDDAKGVFLRFGSGDKAGATSYYSPSLVWTKIWSQKTKPTDISGLGKINIPEGNPPNVGGRNWLLVSLEYSKRGGVYECRKTWLLSGRNGWDTDFY